MKILRIGDPHVKMNNLADSQKMMEFAATQAIELNVDRIEILGDLFHTHAVIRMEVLIFWNEWLDRLAMICETVVLVGNHDQTGDYNSKMHALEVFKHIPNQNLRIIDQPTLIGNIAYVPYIHHEDKFLAACNDLAAQGAKVLVCHATFNGSKYDNGMYAPDGFSFEALNYVTIISGHIHMRQTFGTDLKTVIYPGTAKWDTLSDANEEKGLWVCEHNEDGSLGANSYLDTATIVTPIYTVAWREGEDMPEIKPGRFTMEIIGSSTWVKKQKDLLKGKCGVQSRITDKVRREARKAVGDLSAFVSSSFEPITGVSRDAMLKWMKENDLV